MRVKSGFWSNRRLPKEVQSYCSRHIQADSCHLLSTPTMLPCSSILPVAPVLLADPVLSEAALTLTGCIQCGGEGAEASPWHCGWAGLCSPVPCTQIPPARGPSPSPHTCAQPNVGSDQYPAPAVWPDMEIL